MVFNVKAYGAVGNGSTDDTTDIQSAVTAAASAGGIVYFPTGNYLISAPLTVAGSGVVFQGVSRYAAIITMKSTFADAANGMIEFVSGPSIFDGCGIFDLGFNSTAGTTSTKNNQNCVYQNAVPMSNFNAERLSFTMGVYGQGILFNQLGSVTNPSHDLVFRDIYASNGAGTVSTYNGGAAAGALYRSVVIDNIVNYCSATGLNDDRVAVVGANSFTDETTSVTTTADVTTFSGSWTVTSSSSFPSSGQFGVLTNTSQIACFNYTTNVSNVFGGCTYVLGSGTGSVASSAAVYLSPLVETRDVSVSNVFVDVVSGATGTVNGVKLDAGLNCYLHEINISNVFYNSLTSISSNQPVIVFLGTGAGLENINVENVWGTNCGTVSLRMARKNANPYMRVSNVHITNGQPTSSHASLLEVYVGTAAVGDEAVIIEDCYLTSGVSITGNWPIGVSLTSGSSGQGASGMVRLKNIEVRGTVSTGISNNLNESGSTQASAWSNMVIESCELASASTATNLINTYQILSYVGGTLTVTGNVAITGGMLTMNGAKITNIANGTAATDAAAFGQIAQVPANLQTTSYVPVVGDLGKAIEMNSASTTTITLNTGVFSASNTVEACAIGTGAVNIIPGSGFTLDLAGAANQLGEQFASASWRYRSGSEAVLNGLLVPSVALVQPNTSGFNASTGTVTATLAGVKATSNLILGVEVFTPTTNVAGTISDTGSGTWTNLGVSSDSLNTQHQWFICLNPGAGSHAVTWTGAPSGSGSQSVLTEWSGGPLTLDQQTTQAFTSTTSGGTPAITPNRTPELILVQGSADGGGSTMSGPNNGFTALTTGGPHNPSAYLYTVNGASISCQWTLAPADTGTGSIIAFHQ